MREIKFRAWDGVQILYRDLFDRNWYDLNDIQVQEALPSDKSKLRVEQYTGLKDKNGVDIYERDIVKVNGKVYVIEWNDKASGFRLGGVNKVLYLSSIPTLEVIGNIHENKELLI